MASGFESVPEGRWSTDAQWIAVLEADVGELARRHATRVVEWWEDGIGFARAIGGRLGSGAMFSLTEFMDLDRCWEGRVLVEVDLRDFVERGAESLLVEITEAVGVPLVMVRQLIESGEADAAKARLALIDGPDAPASPRPAGAARGTPPPGGVAPVTSPREAGARKP